MAEIVELVPGMAAIRKEIASLKELQITLQDEEARKLGVIIFALEAALGDLLKGKGHTYRT